MANDPIHVATANPHNWGTARLTLQRHESESFLNAWMHKQIGCTVIAGRSSRVGAVLDPGGIYFRIAHLQAEKLLPLGAIADDQQMKPAWPLLLQKREGPNPRSGIFLAIQ